MRPRRSRRAVLICNQRLAMLQSLDSPHKKTIGKWRFKLLLSLLFFVFPLPLFSGVNSGVNRVIYWKSAKVVELVGFEPTSKRGNHTLSTCLFQTLIFVLRQDLDHQPEPYLLKFHHPCGAKNDYFRFACAALPIRFGTTSMERRLVLLPCKRIKPVIYCTSIRQREHTHCCQLIVDRMDYGVYSRHSACLRTISTRCQIQSTPDCGGFS